MKLRDSGMPDETYWETLFDVTTVMDRLGIDRRTLDLPPWHYGLRFTRIDC